MVGRFPAVDRLQKPKTKSGGWNRTPYPNHRSTNYSSPCTLRTSHDRRPGTGTRSDCELLQNVVDRRFWEPPPVLYYILTYDPLYIIYVCVCVYFCYNKYDFSPLVQYRSLSTWERGGSILFSFLNPTICAPVHVGKPFTPPQNHRVGF